MVLRLYEKKVKNDKRRKRVNNGCMMVLKRIFHISDIHIRNGDEKGSRYEEYNGTFDMLFESVRSKIEKLGLKWEEYLIIVTGDIFHNKNIIGNYGLTLYKRFVTNLTKIGRTIIFHGNHDRNQNEVNQPSLVSSTMEMENLLILNETQSFIIDDIGFSYVSIDDTLDTYRTSGRINDLPRFPEIKEEVKKKIALFHGTFAKVKLYNGGMIKEENNPYPFEWIQEFDYALLGDIHLRQSGKYKNTLWAYSGSLLQQNYGEDIINHGYMIWDIIEGRIDEVNVYNNKGLINLKSDDNGEIMIRIRGNYERLEEIIENNIVYFPKKIEIKLFSYIDVHKLIEICGKYNITFNIISNRILDCRNKDDKIGGGINDEINLDITIDSKTILQYFHKHLTDIQYKVLEGIIKNNDKLLFNSAIYPEELRDDCFKKNKELSVMINNCEKSNDKKGYKGTYLIRYLEWENLYCYENKNWIDFREACSSTFLISGNNGTGKSAIYDIITLSLWGEITVEKQNPLSNGIINYNQEKGYTKVDIEMDDGRMYRIYRKFHKVNDKNLMNKQQIYLYQYGKDGKMELLKMHNGCNQDIKELIGTIDEFLSSSMITQNMDYDILRMDYKDCVSLIDKATNIEYIYNLYTLFKGSINKYKDFKKIIENKKQVYERLIVESSKISCVGEKDDIENEIILLEKTKGELENENNSISIDLNNPKNDLILCRDYEKLLRETEIDITEDTYNSLKRRYNEIEVIFKNTDKGRIEKLREEYDRLLKEGYEYTENNDKPCDYSFIETEERLLLEYGKKPNDEYMNKSIEELSNIVCKNEERLKEIDNEIIMIMNNKPETIVKGTDDNIELDREIGRLFDITEPLKSLKEYCDSNGRMKIYESDETSDSYSICNSICNSICYSKLRCMLEDDKRRELNKIEDRLIELYNMRDEMEYVGEPSQDRGTYIERVEIGKIEREILEDDRILESFYEELSKIHELEGELEIYKTELNVFNTKEEYEYNPKCECCCKRQWVNRIRKLDIMIGGLIIRIEELYDKLYENTENDYMRIYNRNIENKEKAEGYRRHIIWRKYDEYKDRREKTMDEIKNIQESKIEIERNIEEIARYKRTFNRRAHELYDIYKYREYRKWEDEYERIRKERERISVDVSCINRHIYFENCVAPRIANLRDIKRRYKEWSERNERNEIILAGELYEIRGKISEYERYIEYTNEYKMKPLLVRKNTIIGMIREIENKLRNLYEYMTRKDTITEYSKNNKRNHELLENALKEMTDVIDVMNIIIDKFKDYRKELYNTYILKNLVENTNRIICLLCHEETKGFEIDYLITEIRDVIHINWLIKNKGVKNKQTISVRQASGFQHFVISLALRMTLFKNRQYQQLFIDEGFTACDRLNLSIIPNFLKGLLNIYNSIIIVSHIDMIQDCTDNKVFIEYDKDSKNSKIRYGECQG